MKVLLILLSCSVLIVSCSKRALKVMPQIEGQWGTVISAPHCGSSFRIDAESNGHYFNMTTGIGYDGRAKIIDNVLTIGDYEMLTIAEIKDSVGIIPNFDATLCYMFVDVAFDRILRTSNGTVWYHTI